jgi:hypothetical protein
MLFMSLSVTESLKQWAASVEPAPALQRRFAKRLNLQAQVQCPIPDDQVRALLASTQAGAGQADWHTWAPRLALYLGLRAQEIALMRSEDLECREGRWHLVVGGPSKSSRRAAWRSLPLPRALEDEGFVSFILQRKENVGDGPVFTELAAARRPGDAIHTWMRRRRGGPVADGRPVLSMDSLRRTFMYAARPDQGPEDCFDAFVGRAVSRPLTLNRKFQGLLQKEPFIDLIDRAVFSWLELTPVDDGDARSSG